MSLVRYDLAATANFLYSDLKNVSLSQKSKPE